MGEAAVPGPGQVLARGLVMSEDVEDGGGGWAALAVAAYLALLALLVLLAWRDGRFPPLAW
jgi:hypothetical protein